MLPDLERLIRLQQLDTFVEEARRTIADYPDRVQALDARLTAASQGGEKARQRLADNQTARRGLDKDLAMLQSRLAKFKDQLMEVKTNKEYQAMQKEIEGAQTEIGAIEDRILERMLEADELQATVREAEAELAREKAAVAAEKQKLEKEKAALEQELVRSSSARAAIVAEASPEVLALFEYVARGRRGLAVAEARDGHCTICHVRLRPQVFNDVRRNDSIIQCDSCQRILYFVAPSENEAPSPRR